MKPVLDFKGTSKIPKRNGKVSCPEKKYWTEVNIYIHVYDVLYLCYMSLHICQ